MPPNLGRTSVISISVIISIIISHGLAETNATQENAKPDVVVRAVMLESTSSKMSYNQDGIILVYAKTSIQLLLVGDSLEKIRSVKLTTSSNSYQESCTGSEGHYQTEIFVPNKTDYGLQLSLPEGLDYHHSDDEYYFCVQTEKEGKFLHQGDGDHIKIKVTKELLPLWACIIVVAFCLLLSGMFSGLNLGLMSLDKTELKIVINCGSEKEREYAKAIYPVRRMGNYLLCSILLGNVLVNNSLTIVLDSITGGGGALAVVLSTLAIVIFGEIIPQSICSRHGLAVGAHTILLTKLFMLITSPLSFPLSKLLDCVLGREVGTVYNKQKLMELIKVTEDMNDLEKDEVNMVTGALVLSKKCVRDVMTRIEDCYMLSLDSVLDFETVSEIQSQGYSRIPVYQKERTNVVYILFAKDLLFLDTDGAKTVYEVCKFYNNKPNFVFDDNVLTDMFNEFKTGDKGHMAIVQTINNEGEGDPYYETIGLVTLEDIIEEIVQSEIIDETDVVTDNKSRKKRKCRRRKDEDFKLFFNKSQQHVSVSRQVSLAVLQFLTTHLKPFYPENFSQTILQKLLAMDVYREVKLKSSRPGESSDNQAVIMRKGVPCDFFVLIIEGRVEVTIGKEDKTFVEGPFSFFGDQMLEAESSSGSQAALQSPGQISDRSLNSLSSTSTRSNQWLPDYTLRAVTDLVYLKIRRKTYNIAVKTFQLNGSNNVKEDEVIDVLARVTNEDADFRKVQQKLKEDPSFNVSRKDSFVRKSMTSLKTKMSRTSISSNCVEKQREDSISFDDIQDKTEDDEEGEFLEDISASPIKSSGDNRIVFMLGNYEESKVSGDFERMSMLSAEHRVT